MSREHMGGDPGRAERLFRAAVSAFCSLTRPSRREAAQLEDLALPLLERVPVEARRYVAAALSECAFAPNALVRRLCEEPVEVAAPLLARSQALTDIDLIALIGRHGLPHARAIARRAQLHPTIANLIQALEAQTQRNETPAANLSAPAGEAAEAARDRLRGFMLASSDSSSAIQPYRGPTSYGALRETALTGNTALFQTALADALEIDFATARSIATSEDLGELVAALRVLELSEEQAFLLAAAVHPARFAHAEAVRLFLRRFRLLHPEAALERLRGWKAAALAAAFGRAANEDRPIDDLKARFRAR